MNEVIKSASFITACRNTCFSFKFSQQFFIKHTSDRAFSADSCFSGRGKQLNVITECKMESHVDDVVILGTINSRNAELT